MTLPDKHFKKFIGAYLTATAPFLKLRYDSKEHLLTYQYYSKKYNLIKFITISDDYEKILEFFDLEYLKDKDLRILTQEEFIYGILYSTFFNARVVNYKALVTNKASKNLVQALYTKRKRDLLQEDDYLFIDNRHVVEGILEEYFPKSELHSTIDEIEKKAVEQPAEKIDSSKMVIYTNVIRWIPEMKKLGVDKVLGIVTAHQAYIKDVYKRDIVQYTKENDLEQIMKNFKAYAYSMKFVS